MEAPHRGASPCPICIELHHSRTALADSDTAARFVTASSSTSTPLVPRPSWLHGLATLNDSPGPNRDPRWLRARLFSRNASTQRSIPINIRLKPKKSAPETLWPTSPDMLRRIEDMRKGEDHRKEDRPIGPWQGWVKLVKQIPIAIIAPEGQGEKAKRAAEKREQKAERAAQKREEEIPSKPAGSLNISARNQEGELKVEQKLTRRDPERLAEMIKEKNERDRDAKQRKLHQQQFIQRANALDRQIEQVKDGQELFSDAVKRCAASATELANALRDYLKGKPKAVNARNEKIGAARYEMWWLTTSLQTFPTHLSVTGHVYRHLNAARQFLALEDGGLAYRFAAWFGMVYSSLLEMENSAIAFKKDQDFWTRFINRRWYHRIPRHLLDRFVTLGAFQKEMAFDIKLHCQELFVNGLSPLAPGFETNAGWQVLTTVRPVSLYVNTVRVVFALVRSLEVDFADLGKGIREQAIIQKASRISSRQRESLRDIWPALLQAILWSRRANETRTESQLRGRPRIPLSSSVRNMLPSPNPMDVPLSLTYSIPAELRAETAGKPWSYSHFRGPEGRPVKVYYCTSIGGSERVAQEFMNDRILGLEIIGEKYTSELDFRDHSAALVLANEERIAVFHLAFMDHWRPIVVLSPALKEILTNDAIIKVGAQLHDRARSFARHLGVEIEGVLDLNSLHRQLHPPFPVNGCDREKQLSLSNLMEAYLGRELPRIPRARAAISRVEDFRGVASGSYAALHLFDFMRRKLKNGNVSSALPSLPLSSSSTSLVESNQPIQRNQPSSTEVIRATADPLITPQAKTGNLAGIYVDIGQVFLDDEWPMQKSRRRMPRKEVLIGLCAQLVKIWLDRYPSLRAVPPENLKAYILYETFGTGLGDIKRLLRRDVSMTALVSVVEEAGLPVDKSSFQNLKDNVVHAEREYLHAKQWLDNLFTDAIFRYSQQSESMVLNSMVLRRGKNIPGLMPYAMWYNRNLAVPQVADLLEVDDLFVVHSIQRAAKSGLLPLTGPTYSAVLRVYGVTDQRPQFGSIRLTSSQLPAAWGEGISFPHTPTPQNDNTTSNNHAEDFKPAHDIHSAANLSVQSLHEKAQIKKEKDEIDRLCNLGHERDVLRKALAEEAEGNGRANMEKRLGVIEHEMIWVERRDIYREKYARRTTELDLMGMEAARKKVMESGDVGKATATRKRATPSGIGRRRSVEDGKKWHRSGAASDRKLFPKNMKLSRKELVHCVPSQKGVKKRSAALSPGRRRRIAASKATRSNQKALSTLPTSVSPSSSAPPQSSSPKEDVTSEVVAASPSGLPQTVSVTSSSKLSETLTIASSGRVRPKQTSSNTSTLQEDALVAIDGADSSPNLLSNRRMLSVAKSREKPNDDPKSANEDTKDTSSLLTAGSNKDTKAGTPNDSLQVEEISSGAKVSSPIYPLLTKSELPPASTTSIRTAQSSHAGSSPQTYQWSPRAMRDKRATSYPKILKARPKGLPPPVVRKVFRERKSAP